MQLLKKSKILQFFGFFKKREFTLKNLDFAKNGPGAWGPKFAPGRRLGHPKILVDFLVIFLIKILVKILQNFAKFAKNCNFRPRRHSTSFR